MTEQFRVIIQAHKHGRYGYILTRLDKPDWAESSFERFNSVEDALAAAKVAQLRHVQLDRKAIG